MVDANRTLYRAETLDRLSSPDDLERLMPVTGARDWLLIVVTGVLLSLLAIWSIAGRVPTIVAGRGVILRPQQVVPVQTMVAGRLLSLRFRAGDRVGQGDLIATIDRSDILKRIDEDRRHAEVLEEQDRRQSAAGQRQMALQSKQDSLERAGLEAQRATLRKNIAGAESLRPILEARTDAIRKLVTAGLAGAAAPEMTDAELAVRENAAKIEDYSSRLSQIDGQLQQIGTRGVTLARQILDESLQRRNEIARVRRSIEIDAFQVREEGNIHSQYAGTIAEVMATVGQVLPAGGRLLTLDAEAPGIGLVSISYFPVRDGKRIQPGMSVQITPDTVERERFGGILATVTAVSPGSVTREGASSTIGNADMVQSLMPEGGSIEVRARLETDASTASGYRWSSSRGPRIHVTEGLTHATRVTVDGRAPVTYLLPFLRDISRIY
jgi:HlyD family secretion protein